DLYLGASTWPNVVDGGDVIRYDYAANTFETVYQVYEQGIRIIKVLNDKLYIPGTDSMGSWRWGNIYIFDGNNWVKKETVPWAAHVWNIDSINDELYVTAWTVENYGLNETTIYRSADDGDTWEKVEGFNNNTNLAKWTDNFNPASGTPDGPVTHSIRI
ncbi:hypothetical protein LCGC14_2886140, partial [marine sediment metagenome]